MNVNKAIIAGRIVKKNDIRMTTAGHSVVTVTLATNSYRKDASGQKNETTEYHDVVFFGKLADIYQQYSVKGQVLYVEGQLRTRSWQDATGQKKYRTEVIADVMQFGEKPRLGESASNVNPPDSDDIKIEDIAF